MSGIGRGRTGRKLQRLRGLLEMGAACDAFLQERGLETQWKGSDMYEARQPEEVERDRKAAAAKQAERAAAEIEAGWRE